MKRTLSLVFILLIASFVVFAGGSKEAAATDPDAPVTLTWLVSQTSAEVDDDAEVVKMIEDRFDIDLKTWYVDGKNFKQNLNVRFAGGEMPDILVVDSTSELAQYVDGGVVAAVAGFVSTIGNAGLQRAGTVVGHLNWLDRLGLEVPTTLDEFHDVMLAFVNDDPDGNGKNDTAGMGERTFNAIFGAYGLRCVTGGNPNFKVEEMQLGNDNVPFFPYITDRAKEVLALLHEWYLEGIIYKEFVTGENHGGYNWLSHAFMNGEIGVTCAQPYHYLTASTDTSDPKNWGVCMQEFKALNPDADIVIGPAPIGPDGESGTEGWNKVGRLTVITTKCAEDPRKVEKFLEMLDAYYSDPEYAQLVNYGIEGKHFEKTDYGNVRIMEGTDLRKEGVLQVDFGSTVYFAENVDDTKTKFGHEVTGNGYWRFNAPATEEFSSVIATLDTMTEQAYFDMIIGNKPISYFDTFVEEFKKAGGAAAEKAVQDAYAARFN